MNKKLLAIAVGAVIAMPSLALADGPTVYGKMNLTLEKDKMDAAGTDQFQLDSNASRLGVKGSFDLDVAGLKAIYQAEYGTDPFGDSGNAFSERNIFGGLQGSFGTFKAGKFDTPTKSAQGKIDEFNDLDGDLGAIMSGENRAANIMQYSTPKLGDMVTVTVGLLPGEGATVDGKVKDGIADATSVAIALETAGLYAAVAHDSNYVGKLKVDDQGAYVAGVSSDKLNLTRLVAAYKMDAFEVGALYQMAEEAEGKGKDTSMLVSGAYSIDRIKLKAQYGKTDGDVSDDSWTTTSVGADYKLAKASKAFVYYTKVDKDLADTSDTYTGIGLEHKF